MKAQIRYFSSSLNILKHSEVSYETSKSIRPLVKLHHPGNDRSSRSFDKNFPSKTPEKKVWEVQGISKDEFFVRKYGNINDDERKKLDEKVDRQRRARAERYKNESQLNNRGDNRSQSNTDGYYNNRMNTYDNGYSNNNSGYGNFNRGSRRSIAGAFKNPLSEYIYGTHSVISALTANKRGGFNKLYLHNGLKSKFEKFETISKLCKQYGIKIIDDYPKPDMDRLADRGVHNGVILETKKLLLPIISTLPPVELGSAENGEYNVSIHNDLYNTVVDIPYAVARKSKNQSSDLKKYPIGLYLDGITDPQNAGAIIRSAYYLGVDFIVVPEYDTAKLGPIASKASVGALDLMPIYRADDPLKFIDGVKKNGWNIISTDAKPIGDQINDLKLKHKHQFLDKYIDANDLSGMLCDAPMLLVLGSEGKGIRTNMKSKSDYLVGLEKERSLSNRQVDEIVDSLNVSVAAALLISKCVE